LGQPRLEQIDFSPRLPVGRLILTCLVFGFLGWVFVREKQFEFTQPDAPTLRDLLETGGIGLLLLVSFGFITSFLLLQFRLRFSESGIRRFTLFGPWFVPWSAVRTAHVSNYKGYLALELRVSRWRWICIPLLEYRRGARLLNELRTRLPVEVVASEKQLALLSDS
jgi:hypothetical protein